MAAIAFSQNLNQGQRSRRPGRPGSSSRHTPLLVRPSRSPSRHLPSVAVRRRRTAVALVGLAALGTLFGVGSLAGAGQGPASSGSTHLETESVAASTHVVQPGDTLWTLARRLQPEGDVRPLVARLLAAHGSGPLVPGERLRLPV